MQAEVPANEAERLEELYSYGVLDTAPDEVLDELTYLAARICGAPIALISLLDEERQWFKAKVGVEVPQAPRAVAFDAHVVLDPEDLVIVTDTTTDPRFMDNPLVTAGKPVVFFAAVPLMSEGGFVLGTMTVMDRKQRDLNEEQRRALKALARLAMAQLELKRPRPEPAPVESAAPAASTEELATLKEQIEELQEAAEERRRFQDELLDRQRQLEDQAKVLAEESKTDELTGLANQRGFIQRLDEEFSRAHRYEMPLSLAFLDLDHFGKYNQEFGELAGDSVLEQIATLLHDLSRVSDFIARYDGGQFALVLTNTPPEGALIMAERVRAAVEGAAFFGRTVNVSVGIASVTEETENATQLVEEANAAMNEAKKQGRNCVFAA